MMECLGSIYVHCVFKKGTALKQEELLLYQFINDRNIFRILITFTGISLAQLIYENTDSFVLIFCFSFIFFLGPYFVRWPCEEGGALV